MTVSQTVYCLSSYLKVVSWTAHVNGCFSSEREERKIGIFLFATWAQVETFGVVVFSSQFEGGESMYVEDGVSPFAKEEYLMS